ncbi:MAG TPA: BamA/TamA family outer membrane protein [Flavobacteriaceae bacterium]|nr:BamA/TamA family outer membrane protein [Flavobacteriaceae bacterium]
MRKRSFLAWAGFFFLLIIRTGYSQNQKDSLQEKDSFFKQFINYFEEAKKDKSYEKFDISFIGGPSYSQDTKLGLGILASGLYRLDREDLTLPPSDVSIFSNFTTSGFLSFGLENHTIFPQDRYRINLSLAFAYLPTKYYGIGYEAGKRGDYTPYAQYKTDFHGDFLKKILNNTYAGISLRLKNINSKNFEISELKPDERLDAFVLGGGLLLTYDNRDFIPNPSEGFYFKYEENFYPSFLGNRKHFREAFVTARTYQALWSDATLALDLNGIIKTGDVPWNMMSLVGGAYQMRGYFVGQYRDKKQINFQAELRQKIYNRHGMVAWVGGGKIFDKFKDLSADHILPNVGIGYRWGFKDRINVRLDYGYGQEGGGVYFNINEAF